MQVFFLFWVFCLVILVSITCSSFHSVRGRDAAKRRGLTQLLWSSSCWFIGQQSLSNYADRFALALIHSTASRAVRRDFLVCTGSNGVSKKPVITIKIILAAAWPNDPFF